MPHPRLHDMPAGRQLRAAAAGFSLIELMVVLAVLGVLTGIAIPAFTSMVGTMRVKAATSDLMADLAYARAEAIKRSGRVGVAMNGNNWGRGWIVFVDTGRDGYTAGVDVGASVLKAHPALSPTMHMCAKDAAGGDVTMDSVTYGGDGRLRMYDTGALVTSADGLLIHNDAGHGSRMVIFSLVGRASVKTSGFASEVCP